MLGIFAIITGLVLAPSLKEVIDDQRGELGCAFGNLSLGQSANCIIVDLTLPFFVGMVVFGVGLGAIEIGFKGK